MDFPSAGQEALDRIFFRRPASRRLFKLVRDYIASLGPVEVVPRKTQVAFGHGRRFAWVWLPQMWIRQQPADSITLTFSLDHRIADPRIRQSLEPYPGRFTHHVVLIRPKDFDHKVKRWLSDAYEFAASRSSSNGRPPGRSRSRA